MAAYTFGKYQLLAQLGHGGMADVFLAVQAGPLGSGFRKLTVIKRLRQNLVEEPEFVAMLVDEARIAAGLNHPNVVQTNEVGREGDQYFIAMEYLDGQPLHRIQNRSIQRFKDIGSQPFAQEQQFVLLLDVLAGLHHAHELADYDGTPLEIVHRDVTPHNVFVTYEGQVKIVDFGIAKAAGRASETRQGIIKGKVRYMAPEQALGQSIDRRADLFSVGVMLWEAATARRLWRGVEDLEIVQKLLSGNPITSIKEVDPTLPDELDRICKKALALRADDRYATADEFRTDLEQFLVKENLLVEGRRGLARTVCDLFKDKRLEIKTVIEKQLTDLVERPSVRPMSFPVDSSLTPLATPIVEIASSDSSDPRSGVGNRVSLADVAPGVVGGSGDAPAYATAERATPARSRARSRALTAVLVGLLTAGVVGVATWRFTVRAPAVSQLPTSTATGVPTTEPVPPKETTDPNAAPTKLTVVDVSVTPASAKIFIDDAALPPNAKNARFNRDGLSHHIRAEAPGYEERSQLVVYDEAEKHVTLALPRERTPAVAPRTPVPWHPQSKGPVSPTTVATSAAHDPAPAPPTSTPAPPSTQGAQASTAATPPVAPTPAAPAAPAIAPGTVDPKGVKATVNAHKGEIQACYDRAHMDNPELKGRVVLNGTVDPQGRVLSVSLNSTTGSPRLESCLSNVFRTWTFPEPAGHVNGNVTYTINFD